MRFKDNKGITVISLVITIIVMIILAVVTINLGFNSIDKSQDSVISVGIKSVQQAVLEQYSMVNAQKDNGTYIGTPYEKTEWNAYITSDNTGAKNIAWMYKYSDIEEENSLEKMYYKLDEKDLKELGLDSIPKDQFYIVNYKTGEVYDGVNMTFKDGTPAYMPGPIASKGIKTEAFVDNPITISLYKTIKKENGSVSFIIKVEDDICEISKAIENKNVEITKSNVDVDGNMQEVKITNTITDVTKTGSENQDSEYYTLDNTRERYFELGIASGIFSMTDDIITIKIQTGAVEDEDGNISAEAIFTPFIEVAETEQKPKFTLGEVFYGENNKSIEEVSSIAENYDYVIGNYTGKKYGKKASIDLILGDSNQKIKSGLYTFQYIWVKDGDEIDWSEAQQISVNVNKGDKQVKNTIELEKLNGAGKLYVKYLDEDDNKKKSQEVNFDTEPPKLVIDERLCDGVYRALLPSVYKYNEPFLEYEIDRNDINNWSEKLVDGVNYIYENMLIDTFAKLKGDGNLPTYLHFWIEDEISGLDTTNDINSIHQISYYFSESNTIPPEYSLYSTTISKAKIRSTLENSNELDGEKYMSRASFTRPSKIGINESGEYYIWIQNDEKCIDKLKNAADNSWIVSDKKICVDVESPEIASIEADEDDNAIITITDDIGISKDKEDIEQIKYAWVKDKNVDFSNIDFNKSVKASMVVSSTEKSLTLKIEDKPTEKNQEYYLAVSLGEFKTKNQNGYYKYSYRDKAGNLSKDRKISDISFVNYEGATDMSFSLYQTDNMNNFSYPAHYHIDMYSDTGSYLIQKMWWKYDYENSPEYSLMVEEGKKEKPTYHSITIYTNNSTNSNTRYAISKDINVLMNGPIIIYAEDANGKIYTYRYVIGTNEGLHNYGVQSTELIYNITRDNNTIVLPFAEYDEFLNTVKKHGVAHIFWEDNDKQGEFLKEDQYYPSHTYDLGGAYSKQVKIKISGNYNSSSYSAFNYNYMSYIEFPDYYNIRMNCNFSMGEIWDDLEYGKSALVDVASFGAHGEISTGNQSSWKWIGTFTNCKNLNRISAQNAEKSRQALSYVNEFDSTFAGTGLTNISEMMFKKCNNTKYFDRVFKDCTDLTNVSAGVFDECKNAESFIQIFEGCTSLTKANGLFRNCNKVRYFDRAFSNCSNLNSIDSGLFNAKDSSLLETVRSNVGTSFEETFSGCKNLTDIRNVENLFSNCPYATNFGATFSGSGITIIPDRLFYNNPMAWYFDKVFSGTNINTIPANLFSKQTVTPSSFATKPQFSGAFSGCENLTQVKNDFFGSSILKRNIVEVEDMFMNCKNLISVDVALFSGCTSLTNASYVFYNCKNLKNVNYKLFENCTSIVFLSCLFSNCENLETVDYRLFSSCTSVRAIDKMFCNCKKLETVDYRLFSSCTNVCEIEEMFYNCTSLTYLSPNLFDAFKNNTIDCISSEIWSLRDHNIDEIRGIFENCVKLEVAPRLWDLNIWSYKTEYIEINKNTRIDSKYINVFNGNYVPLNDTEILKLRYYADFAEAYKGTSSKLQDEVRTKAPDGIKQLFLNDITTAINNYL